MKQRVRLTESNLHRIVKESVNKILNEKYPRKQGKIQINGEWIDATEDGVDKYGNPMYKTKSDTIKSGRKCKDGSRRIQNFNFRPDITESNLHRIIAESVKKVLKEVAYRPTNAFIEQQISNLDKYQKSETVLRAVSYRILKMAIMLLDKQYQLDCEQLNELVNLHRDANGVEYFEPICIDVLNKAGVEPFKYARGRVKKLVSSYCTYCQENPDQEIRFYEWYQRYAHDNAVKNGHLYNSNLVSETDLHRIVKESVNKVLKEEKSPFIDSELAMGTHDNAAFHRFNLVLDNFARDLIGWIKDEGYRDKIDKFFMPKIMQTIREVLSEYGLPSKIVKQPSIQL